MLTQVQAISSQNTLLNLPLADVSNGLVVADIEGLDPVKATLVSSSFAQLDGEQYQSSRREVRDIKLRIGLEPDYVNEDVRDLRNRLYQFFMTKSRVTLKFIMDDGLEANIVGRVESCETALFTQEPAVDVVIRCFNPDFYDTNVVTVNGTTTSTSTEIVVPYSGSVETGIEFNMTLTQAMSTFTIYHRPPDGILRSLDFVAAMNSGDAIKIVTTPGSKSVTRTRSGSQSSLLYAVSPYSNWIELHPGENRIRVYAAQSGVAYSIAYTTKYGGL